MDCNGTLCWWFYARYLSWFVKNVLFVFERERKNVFALISLWPIGRITNIVYIKRNVERTGLPA